MRETFLRVIRDTAVYGGGDLLVRATGFLTLPIYTRVFSPAEYGVWGYATTAVGLLTGVLALGGDSAYARYYFAARTFEERRTLTSTCIAFLALWSVGVVLLALPFSGLISRWSFGTGKHALLLVVVLLSAPVGLVGALLGEALRNQFRPVLYTVLSTANAVSVIALSLIAVLILHWGLVGVGAGTLLGTLLLLPARIWAVRELLAADFSLRVLRQLLHFGVPLVPVSVAYWVFAYSDRIVIAKLSTLAQVGLYSVAASVTAILALAHGALGQAWSPHAMRMYEEDPEFARAFFGRMLAFIVLLFGALCVAISAFAPEILRVVAPPSYEHAATAVAPLCLGYLAFASTQVTALGISLAKRTVYFAVFAWMAAALNLALNLALVPIWGMVASAWATAASYLMLSLAYFRISQRLWPIEYDRRRVLTASVVGIAFTAGAHPLLETASSLRALAASGYVLAFLALLFAFGLLQRRDIAFLAGRTTATGDSG